MGRRCVSDLIGDQLSDSNAPSRVHGDSTAVPKDQDSSKQIQIVVQSGSDAAGGDGTRGAQRGRALPSRVLLWDVKFDCIACVLSTSELWSRKSAWSRRFALAPA